MSSDFYEAMKEADPDIRVCAGFTDKAFIAQMGASHPYDCFQVRQRRVRRGEGREKNEV